MNIVLREWASTDELPLTSLANNSKVSDNMRDQFPYPYTLADARNWISMNENKIPANSFAIIADNQFAGGCGFFIKEDVYRCSAEIGYWMGEQFWGKGIATEAIGLLLQKISTGFPAIVRVYAEVFEYNKASMKVLEKNGFYLEAIRKKAVIKNGRIISDYIWVKLTG